MKCMVGIDVGTSKTKICVYGLQGKEIAVEESNSMILKPAIGFSEIDVEALFSGLIASLGKITENMDIEVQSIGFSVSSPTVVFLDKEGKLTRNAVLYLDNRSLEIIEYYKEQIGFEESFQEMTGNHISPSTCTAALMKWVEKKEPDVWSKTHQVAYLNSYLAYKFTGVLKIDPTIASYSGLVNIRNPYRWDSELLETFDLTREKLPQIVSPFECLGSVQKEVANKLGISEGVKVALGCADTAASSFALGVNQAGDAFQSMGTSEVLTVCLSTPDFSGAFMNRSHVLPGRWLAHGAMSSTGAAIAWISSAVFPDIDTIENLELEAEKSEPGASGVVLLPYLSGERSPIFDSRTYGVLFGLSLSTNRNDIVRAVYESAAYGMYQIYQIARKKWNLRLEQIPCVGGASSSSLVMQIRADLFGLDFDALRVRHASAYGAAVLGAIARGLFDVDSFPSIPRQFRRYSANLENQYQYQRNFSTYSVLYEALKDTMHAHYLR